MADQPKTEYIVGLRWDQGIEVITRMEQVAALRAGQNLMPLTEMNTRQGFCVVSTIEIERLHPTESPQSMHYRAVSKFAQDAITPLQEIHDLTSRFLEIADWETGDEEEARRIELILRYVRKNVAEVAGYDGDLYCYKLTSEDTGLTSYAWYASESDAPANAILMNFFEPGLRRQVEDLGPQFIESLAGCA